MIVYTKRSNWKSITTIVFWETQKKNKPILHHKLAIVLIVLPATNPCGCHLFLSPWCQATHLTFRKFFSLLSFWVPFISLFSLRFIFKTASLRSLALEYTYSTRQTCLSVYAKMVYRFLKQILSSSIIHLFVSVWCKQITKSEW